MSYIARDGSVVDTPRTTTPHGSHEAVHGMPQSDPESGKYPKWMHKSARDAFGKPCHESLMVRSADAEDAAIAAGYTENA